jgi:hypothetical protein
MVCGVYELIVLKSLLGLLIHWFQFPFLLAAVLPLERTRLRALAAQSFKSISAANRTAVFDATVTSKKIFRREPS